MERVENIRLALRYWKCCANYFQHIARKSIDQIQQEFTRNRIRGLSVIEMEQLHLELGKYNYCFFSVL